MKKFKLDEIVSSSGKSIVYHRTARTTIDTLNHDLVPARITIDKNTTEADIKYLTSGNLPISYTYAMNEVMNKINGIDASGVKINPGMYGPPGVYNTYELSSQFTGRMYGYGCVIVKSFLKMNHVLILDHAYAQKIYGTLSRPMDQLKLFKAKLSATDIRLAEQAYAKSIKDKNYLTSNEAAEFTMSKSFEASVSKGTIKGIVFTGSNDGQVLVAYDHDILIPISYCFSDNTKQITNWFKFSSTGGRAFRKSSASQVKYEYDFNDSSILRGKWFSQVLMKNDYPAILDALEQKYIYPLMMVDGDFLIFKFASIKDEELMKKLFEVSNVPIVNVKSKKQGSNLLLEAANKGNFILANYIIDNYSIVNINIEDKAKTKLIDVLRTKASISDNDEINFWNKLVKKKHYLDKDDLYSMLNGMGLLQEGQSRLLKVYRTIY